MLLNLAFGFLMLVACVPALLWGGWEGRRICLMFVVAGLATYLGATVFKPLVGLPEATVLVDLLLLGALLQVAVRTDRYWPLWICAFHALSIVSFLAWQIVPDSPRLFKAISAVWSIPELIVLCVGPLLDLRHASRGMVDAERRYPE
jgi:hypothetical protein